MINHVCLKNTLLNFIFQSFHYVMLFGWRYMHISWWSFQECVHL